MMGAAASIPPDTTSWSAAVATTVIGTAFAFPPTTWNSCAFPPASTAPAPCGPIPPVASPIEMATRIVSPGSTAPAG